jgi:tape measure domain-containing protein
MVQVAKLSADLYANTSRFETGMRKASGVLGSFSSNLDRSMGRNGRSFDRFNSRVTTTTRTIGFLKAELLSFAGVAAGAFSASKIVRYSDTFKELEGRLRVATGGAEDLLSVQEKLFQVSQKSSAPLKDVIDAYSRISLSLSDVQKETTDLVSVTDLLSKTLTISGASASGAATFFQQFGQAASSDFKAVGQEIQTFADQNAFFIKILQEQLDTGGRSIKEFAADGELSFDLIASAVIGSADRINTAFEEVPDTVGKALQRLDNAFLKLIGQSDLADRGVSSLASGINLLTDNLENVATAVAGLAVVMGARLVGSLTATATALAANTLQATAYQLALARMAGVSGVAATAQLGLAGALRAVSASFALVGGPLGAALIGTYFLMRDATNAASDGQKVLNSLMDAFREKAKSYANASMEKRKQIVSDIKSEIKAGLELLKTLDVIEKKLLSENALFRGLRGIGSSLGIDTSADDIAELRKNTKEAITELEGTLKTFDEINKAPSNRKDKNNLDADQQKSLDKILDGLKKESDQLKIQTDLYGKKESAIDAALRKQEIEAELAKQGIELTKEQRDQIDKYISDIEKQTDMLEDQKKTSDDLKKTYDELGDSFSSAFEDAIINGEKLGDVLRSLGQDIARLLLKKTIGGSLEDSIGGLVGNIFGGFSFGSFATGIQNVPYDMTARLHKGEAVIPAQQAAKLSNSGEGYVVNIDARGAEAGVEEKIKGVMQEVMALRNDVPNIAVSSVASANKRNPRFLNG